MDPIGIIMASFNLCETRQYEYNPKQLTIVFTAYMLTQCWCIIALSILQRYLKKNLFTLNQLKMLSDKQK